MTYEFEYLMHLFSCGVRGMIPHAPCQPVDFDRMMQLAQDHSIIPLIGSAISKAPDFGFPIDKEQALVKITRSLALTNFIKKRQVLKLLHGFEMNGIQAVLLKGYPLADLYAEPDCRISTDTDIYVDIKDEKRAYKLLMEHGCKVTPRLPLSHHAICKHPQMGCIELHVILFDEIVEDIWFGKMTDRRFITEEYEMHPTEDGSFLTLGKTDNLIFLVLHMIKHFILGGISLRQMMDVALYLKSYQPKIDIKRFWDLMESLKYRKLMNVLLSVLVSYCGFSPNDFLGYDKAEEAAVSAFLADLEAGDWLGSSEEEGRKEAWYSYNRTRYSEQRITFPYWCYMVKRNALFHIQKIFPPRAILETKYPYVRKSKWLIPVTWFHRPVSGLIRRYSRKPNAGTAAKTQHNPACDNDRTHLFKLMQMM